MIESDPMDISEREARSEPKDLQWLLEFLNRNWPKLLVILALLSLGFALVRGISATVLAGRTVAPAKQGQLGDPERGELVVVAWLDRNPVRFRRQAKVWYRFQNLTDKKIQGLRGQLGAPGFRPGTLRWRSPVDIPPGTERMMWVPLTAATRSGTFSLATALGWREEERVRQGTVAIDNVQTIAPSWLFAAHAAEAFLQVLALPAIIALLGWIFQFRQQRFAIERQAWSSMLPESHKNNVKYYLPLHGTLGSFDSSVREFQDNDKGLEGAFFDLLLTLRLMRDVPGFYLVDRMGEDLVNRLWYEFIKRLLREMSTGKESDPDAARANMGRLVDLLKPADTLSTFEARMSNAAVELSALREALQGRFGEWSKGPRKVDFEILALFRELLWFEVNRIYDFWYGRPVEFPTEAFKESLSKVEADLPQQQDGQTLGILLKQLSAYLANAVPTRMHARSYEESGEPAQGTGERH
jgi:hypothetical protein